MSTRPPLTAALPPEEFADHYWLKSELIGFCRQAGISAAGSKQQLNTRITALLAGSDVLEKPKARARGKMPSSFSRNTVIGEGWSCSNALRAFLSGELGKPFRFDQFMRDQIHNGAGKTLGEVISAWSDNRLTGESRTIAPQFEYNRFVRELRSLAPGASHRDIVAAWKKYRDTPVSRRPPITAMMVAPCSTAQKMRNG